jgi:hypothetical protein
LKNLFEKIFAGFIYQYLLVIITVLFLYKIPEIINLDGEKPYFGAEIWRVQSIITKPYCFEPMMEQHILVEVCHREKLLTLQLRNERERGRAQGTPSMT